MSNGAPGQWPSGFMIKPRVDGPDRAVCDALASIPVPNIGDVMGRSSGAFGLKAFHGNDALILCGPALTVRVRPGDNLMIHKALTMARRGDVLVIDGAGAIDQALVGGLMRRTAMRIGLAGFVIDGAIRDVREWREDGVAVFARGTTHRGPAKEGPGMINVPVTCAGMIVQPGDLIVGDVDGVLAIPAAEAEVVLERATAHVAREARIATENDQGTSDPERFDQVLRKLGCPV